MAMQRVVKVPLKDGASICFEGEDLREGRQATSSTTERVIDEATQTFEETVHHLAPIVGAVRNALAAQDDPPNHTELEFGFSLRGDVGAIVVKGGAKCHFKVKATWSDAGS